MTALSNKAFSFASQAKAANGTASKQKVIGAFTIGDQSFDIVEQQTAGIAYLVYDMQSDDQSKVVATVLSFTERALTPDSATRFKKVVLGGPGVKGLELTEVVEVFEYILQVVSGAIPPTSPSASSARRRKATSV